MGRWPLWQAEDVEAVEDSRWSDWVLSATGTFVQQALLCNGHFCATGTFVQQALLCNGHFCATGTFVQQALLCNRHFCATGTFVQRALRAGGTACGRFGGVLTLWQTGLRNKVKGDDSSLMSPHW